MELQEGEFNDATCAAPPWQINGYYNAKDIKTLATYQEKETAQVVFHDLCNLMRNGEVADFTFPTDPDAKETEQPNHDKNFYPADLPNLELVQIPLSVVKPSPLNPRKNFDDASFNDLVDSVQMLGVQQPITVRKTEQLIDSVLGKEHGHYFYFHEIVSGERRFRAAVIAGLETIPALIRQGETSDAELVELALIENLQRSNLNPMEEGDGFAKMLELSPNLTQADLAHRLGKSQSYISNAIRLRDLPQEVKELLGRDTLQRAHAVALVAIADLPECVKLAQKAVRENLTQKEVEEGVKTIKDAQKAKDQPTLLDVPKDESKSDAAPDVANGIDEDPAGQAHFDDDEKSAPAPVVPSVTDKVTTTETTKHETLTTAVATPAKTTVPSITEPKITGDAKGVSTVATVPVAPVSIPVPSEATSAAATDEITKVPDGPRVNTSISAADDHWIWEKYTTIDGVIAAYRAHVEGGFGLSSLSIKCLKALTDSYNEAHPDAPIEPAFRLELLLVAKVSDAGFDIETLKAIPE